MKTKTAAGKFLRETPRGAKQDAAGNPPRAAQPDDGVTANGSRRERLGRAGENLAFPRQRPRKLNATDKAAGSLLDKIPTMDGLEVLRPTESDPVPKTVPIIVPTFARKEQDVLRSQQLGVNSYVVKPVGFERFGNAARQVGVFWAPINEPASNHAPQRQAER